MAIADIRQRPGVLLGAAILLHVVLISAQVNSASGLPILQVVTFGGFSELQRGTTSIVDGVRGMWSGYVALRQVQSENDALSGDTKTLESFCARLTRFHSANENAFDAPSTLRSADVRSRGSAVSAGVALPG